MALSSLPSDVLLLIAPLLDGIDLIHLTITCRRIRDVLAKNEVWQQLFCTSDVWAMTELSCRGTWKAVYRNWLREAYYLWKAARYSEWPTVLGNRKSFSIDVIGSPGCGTTTFLSALYGNQQKGVLVYRDSWGNRFPFRITESRARSVAGLHSTIVVVLFDASDKSVQWLQAFLFGGSTSYETQSVFLVETKIDKIVSDEMKRKSEEVRSKLGKTQKVLSTSSFRSVSVYCHGRISSFTGEGIAELLHELTTVCCSAPRQLVTEANYKTHFKARTGRSPWEPHRTTGS